MANLNLNKLIASELHNPIIATGTISTKVARLIGNIVENQLVCNFRVTSREQDALEAIFPGQITWVPSQAADHPVLGFVYQQATENVYSTLKLKNVLVVGTTFKEMLRILKREPSVKMRGILGLHDARDFARYKQGMLSAKEVLMDSTAPIAHKKLAEDYLSIADAIFSGDKTAVSRFFCTKWSYTQIRDEQYDIAIAVESVYDQSPESVYRYMKHFGVIKLVATALTCFEMLNSEEFRDPIFGVTWRNHGNQFVTMTHDGSSMGYGHRFDTFMFWTLSSVWKSKTNPTECMLIERVKAYANYTVMEMTIVPYFNIVLTRTIPSQDSGFVRLFDPVLWMERRKKKHFWVQRGPFEQIFYFCMRQQADSFDPAKIEAYAHTKINSLKIADAVIHHNWFSDCYTVNKTVQFCIMVATFSRGETFKVLLESLKSSKKGGYLKDYVVSPLTAFVKDVTEPFFQSTIAKFFGVDKTKVLDELEKTMQRHYNLEQLFVEIGEENRNLQEIFMEIPDCEPMPDETHEPAPIIPLEESRRGLPNVRNLAAEVDSDEEEFSELPEESPENPSKDKSSSSSSKVSAIEFSGPVLPPQIFEEPSAPQQEELPQSTEEVLNEIFNSTWENQAEPEMPVAILIPNEEPTPELISADVSLPAVLAPEEVQVYVEYNAEAQFPPEPVYPEMEEVKKPSRFEQNWADSMSEKSEEAKNQKQGPIPLTKKKKVEQDKAYQWIITIGRDEFATKWWEHPLMPPMNARWVQHKFCEMVDFCYCPVPTFAWIVSNRGYMNDHFKCCARYKHCSCREMPDFEHLTQVAIEYSTNNNPSSSWKVLNSLQFEPSGGQVVDELTLEKGRFVVSKQLALEQLSYYQTQYNSAKVNEEMAETLTLSNLHGQIEKHIGRLIAQIEGSDKEEFVFDVTLWDCVAGAGKTTKFLEHFSFETDAYICTTSEGREDFEREIKAKKGKLPVYRKIWTHEISIVKPEIMGTQRFFIDEVFTLNYAHLLIFFFTAPDAKFTCAGDYAQYKAFDKNSKFQWSVITAPKHFQSFKTIQRQNRTYRFGSRMCDLLNKACPGYNIVSAATDEYKGVTLPRWTSLQAWSYKDFMHGRIPDIRQRYTKCGFLKPSKDIPENLMAPVTTVRTAQGFTFDAVNVYIGNNDLAMMNSSETLIVSLTRGKYHVNLIEIDPGALKKLNVEFEPMLETLLPVFDTSNTFQHRGNSIPESDEPKPQLKSCDFSKDVLNSLLMELPENVFEAHQVALPKEMQSAYKISPDSFTQKVYNYRGFYQSFRGRVFRVSHETQTVKTFITRLAASYKQPWDKVKKAKAITNFKKMYLRPDFDISPVEEILNKAANEIAEKYKATNKEFQVDPNGSIQGHLKTIIKTYVNDLEKIMSGKAGQPITGWPSTFNLMFGPLFRAMAVIFRQMLKENTVFANGMDEGELAAAMVALDTFTAPFAAWDCSDMPEYDTSQWRESLKAEFELTKPILHILVGEKEWLFDLYYLLRTAMVLFAGSFSALNEQKTSGEPGTFLFNTILLMLIWALHLEPKEYICGAFGGDDTMIKHTVTNVQVMNKRWRDTGFKVKMIRPNVPYFFNCFFKDGLLIYDPLRLAWSLFSKNMFRSSKDEELKYIEALKIAIHDKLVNILRYKQLIQLCMKSHYDMGAQHTELLLEQLQAFTSAPAEAIWAQTVQFQAEV